MKKLILFTILCIYTFQAQAGFVWFLAGSVVGSSGRKTQPQKSELEYQIDNIKNQLPPSCGDITVWSACWGKHRYDKIVLNTAKEKREEIYAYFKNRGYNVKLDGSNLVFDYSESYKKYLEHKQLPISMEMTIALLILASLVGFYIKIKLKYKRRVQQIKKFYENNPDAIMFSGKGDKEKLENSLTKGTLPLYWSFKLNEEKQEIHSISYYGPTSVGVIAWNSANMIKSLENLHIRRSK